MDTNNSLLVYDIEDNTLIESKSFFSTVVSDEGTEATVSIDKEKIKIDDSVLVNMGIHYYGGRLYTSNYVGFGFLKDTDNNVITQGKYRCAIRVRSRFNIDGKKILESLRKDDEFIEYLVPQKNKRRDNEELMDSYAGNELFTFFLDEDAMSSKDENGYENIDLFSAFSYVAMLGELCKRPLMGKMVKKEGNLVGKIRGRIVVNKNIRKNSAKGRDDRFYCEYPEYTTDILENQILKAALHKVIRYIGSIFKEEKTKKDDIQKIIVRCLNTLEDISDIDVGIQDFAKVKVTGIYPGYKKVLKMAEVIIQEISIDVRGNVGESGYIVPYALSMQRLYETYVRSYLKQNGMLSYIEKEKCTANELKGKYILRGYNEQYNILASTKNENDCYLDSFVRPDIVIETPKGEFIILDVKYKNYKASGRARGDRLQLLAYAMLFKQKHIGFIFPGEPTDTKAKCYESRKLREGSYDCMYHQMILPICDSSDRVYKEIKEKMV